MDIASRKYTRLVLPKLDQLKNLKQAGATIGDLAKHVGIHPDTMQAYIRKALDGEPEFAELLELYLTEDDRTKEVEQALLRRAVGYDYTEETIEYKADKDTGALQKTLVKRVKKHVSPDPKTAMWWLAKRDPARWGEVTGADGGGCGVVEIPEVIGKREAVRGEGGPCNVAGQHADD